MAKHESPTTTWNHPDWHIHKTSCQLCGADILEAKPIVGEWFYRSKRTECYQCLARWFNEVLKQKRRLGAARKTNQPRSRLH